MSILEFIANAKLDLVQFARYTSVQTLQEFGLLPTHIMRR